MSNDENEPEHTERRHRRDWWDVTREITGTFVGVLPYVVMLFLYLSSIDKRMSLSELRLERVEIENARQDQAAERQRQDVISKIDKLSEQMGSVQAAIARLAK